MTQKIMSQIYEGAGHGLAGRYREMTVGGAGAAYFLYYEFVTALCRNMSGALGLFLRSRLYRPLFRKIGRGVIFGAGVTLRNPGAIEIGDQVIVDDNCVLDAKGDKCEGIVIGNRVFLSRNVIIACKDGGIRIGGGTSIGPNSLVHSVAESKVMVGEFCMLGAYCYLIGSGDYKRDRLDAPMMSQGLKEGKGIVLEEDVWLGAGVYVLDGSCVRKGSIIGAKGLVKGEIPAWSVAVGCPAVVVAGRTRESGTRACATGG